MLTIDGSHGEGGGQVLRTALSLSAILGQPVTIERIRAGRPNPGLQRQHLACVKAVAKLSAACVEGDELGSQRVVLHPGPVQGGQYRFDVGAGAGSAMLILQTVLPALCFARSPSRVTIRGGTHNHWAPPFDYVERVFLPTVARFGVQARVKLKKAGWYPKGGGEVTVEVNPSEKLMAVDLSERGALERLEFMAVSSNLPPHIARRQCETARLRLASIGAPLNVTTRDVPSIGAGTMSLAVARFEQGVAGFSALGERGKPAETVAAEACEGLLNFINSAAVLDRHMADQAVLYAILAAGETCLTTEEVTRHLLTNLWVVGQFVGERFNVEGEESRPGSICIRGIAYSPG